MKKKSEFYHLRVHKIGINETITADVLSVSIEQVLKWDDEGAPKMAEKLLLLWNKKRVGCTGWDGWYFSRDVLCYKKLRFRPESLLSLVSVSNEVDSIRRQLSRIESSSIVNLAIQRLIKQLKN